MPSAPRKHRDPEVGTGGWGGGRGKAVPSSEPRLLILLRLARAPAYRWRGRRACRLVRRTPDGSPGNGGRAATPSVNVVPVDLAWKLCSRVSKTITLPRV